MEEDLLFQTKKDKEWFLKVKDHYTPFYNNSFPEYEKLKGLYGIINNDFAYIKTWMENVADPTGGIIKDVSLPDMLESIPIFYNRIFPKFSYHLGEMIKLSQQFDVIPIGDFANDFKDEEYNQYVSDFVDDMIARLLQPQSKSQPESAESEVLQEKPESYDNFVSSIETFNANVIEYFFSKFNINQVKSLMAKHILCADRVFVDIVFENGELKPVVYNVLQVDYDKATETDSVSYSDYFCVLDWVTLREARFEVSKHGTKEDLDTLVRYEGARHNRPRKEWDIKSAKSRAITDHSSTRFWRGVNNGKDKDLGTQTGTQSSGYLDDRIERRRLKFPAFVKVKMLTYVNEYNKTVIEPIDYSFKIPKEAVRTEKFDEYNKSYEVHEWIDEFGNPMSVESKIIMRRYECTIYGDDIVINYGEAPFQPTFPSGLSVKGRIFSSLNSNSVSIVERGLSTQLLYILVKKLQMREISKYKGFQEIVDLSDIPDYLLKDENGNPLFESDNKLVIYEYFQRILGKSISDSTANKVGLMQPGGKPRASNFEASQYFAEIINMQNFCELLDRELGVQMLVPPQAEGMVERYTNTTDNQRSLTQALTMAYDYYMGTSDIVKDLVEEYMIQFRMYYQKYFRDNPDKTEVNLNYVIPGKGRRILKIIPDYLNFSDVGLFLKDSSQNEEYRNLMMNIGLQPIAQNRGEGAELFSTILKSMVRNESPEEIHKMIVIASKKQQEYLKQIELSKQQILLQIEQAKQAQVEGKNQNNIEVEKVRGQYDILAKSVSGGEDKDEINAILENAKVAEQIRASQAKTQNDAAKIDIQRAKSESSVS